MYWWATNPASNWRLRGLIRRECNLEKIAVADWETVRPGIADFGKAMPHAGPPPRESGPKSSTLLPADPQTRLVTGHNPARVIRLVGRDPGGRRWCRTCGLRGDSGFVTGQVQRSSLRNQSGPEPAQAFEQRTATPCHSGNEPPLGGGIVSAAETPLSPWLFSAGQGRISLPAIVDTAKPICASVSAWRP
jgi:hypothetical protein